MNEYIVIFEEAADGGWGAYVPDLPGVVAIGESRAQVTARIQEALDAYGREMRVLGRDLPVPAHAAGTAQLS